MVDLDFPEVVVAIVDCAVDIAIRREVVPALSQRVAPGALVSGVNGAVRNRITDKEDAQ